MTFASFIARYPEFNTITVPTGSTVSAVVQVFLDDADAYISDSAFGTFRDLVVCLYAAHRIAVRYKVNLIGLNDQLSPGVATSVSAQTNGLSVVNSVSSKVMSHRATDADFARTNYGLEYLMMIEQCIPGGKAVY